MCADYSFFAEYLPRVSAFHIAFTTKENCKLSFSGRRVYKTSLRQHAGACKEEICQWPPHLPELDPSSCQKLGPEAQSLQLRFQARKGSHPSWGSEIESPRDPLDEITSHQITIKCGFCLQSITKPNNCFTRVLPLPSDEWSELAGDAFCHHHHTTSPPHPPHTLSPRRGDCLTGVGVVRVTGESVKCDILTSKQGGVSCGRCHTDLGVIMGYCEETKGVEFADLPLEFTRARISLEIFPPSSSPSPSPSPPPVSLQSFAMSSLSEKQAHLAQRLHSAFRTKSSFKLNVQDSHGRVYVHVWMLSVISHVTSNTYHMTSQLSSKFSGIPTPPLSPPHTLTHHHALKLLYVIATVTDHAPWSRDSAEPLPLTVEECLWLCVLVCQSSRSLPPSQRSSRGLNVGYLTVGPTTL